MKVTYIGHSGYMVEAGDVVLIFDYYHGKMPEVSPTAKVYVFASHVHPDHFNKKIFEWEKKYSNIRYILSDDIKAKGPEEKVTYVGPWQELEFEEIKVRTLRSTDEGVAFLVRCIPEGTKGREKVIYHAGDLNWWHWVEEGETYNEMMRQRYQREIRKMEGINVDVAFLTLDPRQEEQYLWGFDYFMRHIDTKCAFPMHMWNHYETCDRLYQDPLSEPYRNKVMRIREDLQVFEIGF